MKTEDHNLNHSFQQVQRKNLWKFLILLGVGSVLLPLSQIYAQVVTVPNVVGLSQVAAQTAITNAGLTLGTVTTISDGNVLPGTVISQSPEANTNVGAGSGVDLLISQGILVPPLQGLTQAGAQAALTNTGLQVGTITSVNSLSCHNHRAREGSNLIPPNR